MVQNAFRHVSPFQGSLLSLIAPRGVAPGWYVDAPSGLHCTDTKNDQILPKQTAEYVTGMTNRTT